MDEKGVWSFSPVYDVTFSNGIDGGHSTLYFGEGKNPTSEHLLELAKKHGIKKGAVIIDEVREAVSDWASFVKEAMVSKKSWQSIGNFLKELNF